MAILNKDTTIGGINIYDKVSNAYRDERTFYEADAITNTTNLEAGQIYKYVGDTSLTLEISVSVNNVNLSQTGDGIYNFSIDNPKYFCKTGGTVKVKASSDDENKTYSIYYVFDDSVSFSSSEVLPSTVASITIPYSIDVAYGDRLVWLGNAWDKLGGTDENEAIAELNQLQSQKPVELVKISGTPIGFTPGALSTRYGFAMRYNMLPKFLEATTIKIYVIIDSAFTGLNNNVTLFAQDNGVDNGYNPLKETTVICKETGYYELDMSGVDLSDYEFLVFGYKSNTACFDTPICSTIENYTDVVSLYLFSMSSSGSWFGGNTTNSGVLVEFYKPESGSTFPADELNKCIIETADSSDANLRIALISDIHWNDTIYGYDSSRIQVLIDSLNKKHAEKPFDFVLFVGDLVTLNSTNGAQKIKVLKDLVDIYLSQLKMPWFVQRGNHDGYTDEEWETIIGNKAQFSIETGDYYFLCIDAYPYIENRNDGKTPFKWDYDMWYTGMDYQLPWINAEIEKARKKHKKIIPSYHFHSLVSDEYDSENETTIDTEWRNILSSSSDIICQIMGHSHNPYIMNNASTLVGKPTIGTGNFGGLFKSSDGSYPTYAGFGYKILESANGYLQCYHVYPELTYPAWKTGTTEPYPTEEREQAYSETEKENIEERRYIEGADYNLIKLKSTKSDVYTKSEIDSKLDQKQNTLTFDNTPTSGSNNPVTSNGIKSALDTKANIDDVESDFQEKLTFDTTPTAGSNNPVTSDGLYKELQTKFSKLGGTISGPVTIPAPDHVIAPAAPTTANHLTNKAYVDGLVAGKQDVLPEGTVTQYYRGDKTLADFAGDTRSVTLSGVSFLNEDAITATDTFIVAMGKLQAQITMGQINYNGDRGSFWSGEGTWENFANTARTTVLTGLSTTQSTAITATDTVLGAFGKLQGQLGNKVDIKIPTNGGATSVNGGSVFASIFDIGGGDMISFYFQSSTGNDSGADSIEVPTYALVYSLLGDKLSLTGGSLTGDLIVAQPNHVTAPQAPTNGGHLTNKTYVDGLVGAKADSTAVVLRTMIDQTKGLLIDGDDQLRVETPQQNEISAKTSPYKPFTPSNIDYGVYYSTHQNMSASYNPDSFHTSVEFTAEKNSLPVSYQAVKGYVDGLVGDIEEALDGIIALQNQLISGQEVS